MGQAVGDGGDAPARRATRSRAPHAWVPSPTAATLHSTHYFDVGVAPTEIQGRRGAVEELTTIPLLEGGLTEADIQTELDNNCQ